MPQRFGQPMPGLATTRPGDRILPDKPALPSSVCASATTISLVGSTIEHGNEVIRIRSDDDNTNVERGPHQSILAAPANLRGAAAVAGSALAGCFTGGAVTTGGGVAQVAQPAAQVNAALPNGAQPWDSGMINPGQTYRRTFTVAGQYSYFCIPHESMGMVGKIVVQ